MFKNVQDNMQKEDPQGDDMEQFISNSCINHPYNNIEFIVQDQKIGVCSDCIYDHYKQGHKLISVNDTIFDVQQVLMNMEVDLLDVLAQKTQMLAACEDHIEFINGDKNAFLTEQRKKIDALHEYLEKRFSDIVADYNKSIEKDLLNIRNNRERLNQELEMNTHQVKKVQEVRSLFEENEVPNIIQNFVKAGKFFKEFKKMKIEYSK